MSDNSSSLSHCYNMGLQFSLDVTAAVIRAFLLLPACTLVFYLGHRRWRRQRSVMTTSHSDIFTYHMAAMELMWLLGFFCIVFGTYAHLYMVAVGSFATSTALYGQVLFHVLTCVERYLAVVHPVTYLRLKNVRGVWIRNVSICCVWLLSFGNGGVTVVVSDFLLPPLICLLVFSLIVVSFCSVSIICVLIRPGPGDGGQVKERVDQSKQRVFHTVSAILGVLLLWLAGLLLGVSLRGSPLLSPHVSCVVFMCVGFFNLPSSLLLPLLYLHRAGRLPCCQG